MQRKHLTSEDIAPEAAALIRDLKAENERLRDGGEVKVRVPPMPETLDRRPFVSASGEIIDGYFEGDREWAEENQEAVAWLADNHVAIRSAIECTPAGRKALEEAGDA